MKDRIQQLIDYKGITAGVLAEKLEVQRSNVSHILNGRNKPGAAFLEKLLLLYPDINARWLLTGIGEMLTDSDFSGTSSGQLVNREENVRQTELFQPVNDPAEDPSKEPVKGIEKILLLYTDGSFKHYDSQ